MVGAENRVSLGGIAVCLGLMMSGVCFAAKGDPAAGKAIYEHKCAKCHGVTGDGKGRAGRSLEHKPTAFNDKKKMDGESDDKLFKSTKQGGVAVGQSKEMEAFPDLKDQDNWDVIAYIRSLGK